MQCVILAAGKGTRMRPLTEHLPKPLVEVCNKPLLFHVFDALPENITGIVLVVSYKADMLRETIGSSYKGLSVHYVHQDDPSGGTGQALLLTKHYVQDHFLLMYADDIHGAQALRDAVQHESSLLVQTSDHPQDFGVVLRNEDGTLMRILEKPEEPPSNLVSVGGMVLLPDIYTYETALDHRIGEVLLTDMVNLYALNHPIHVVEQATWYPVGRPEDITAAESALCPEMIDKKVGV